jgi:hypothetical protein
VALKASTYVTLIKPCVQNTQPLGRSMRRWKDNIKIYLQKVGCWGKDWIDLDQDRGRWRALVNAVMNLRVLYNAGNFLIS